jgi:transcriptional regulator with XRE-family HTH domain
MSVLEHVAGNVRRLRGDAGLSQQALAERAAVSRRMLVGIESGDANVSLNTLDRIAEALSVKFADLVRAPGDGDRGRIGALAWSGRDPASQGVLLASAEVRDEVELWAFTLMPGECYDSPADPPGWREMFYVIEGCLSLITPEGVRRVEAGDFLVVPSDVDHSFRNDGSQALRFVRNVVR